MAGGYFLKTDIQALKQWKHGKTYIRLPNNNNWTDYPQQVTDNNGMKMLIGKSMALNYVLDLPEKYDFIILTRTDFHVPCITEKDFALLYKTYSNALKNETCVFDGQYCWKLGSWQLLIDDNFTALPATLVYKFHKQTIRNTYKYIT